MTGFALADSRLDFLLGEWKGESASAAGGGFSFERQLDGKIVVRKNHSIAQDGSRHEDLMIVYTDSDKPNAVYFDNEGHVIRYQILFEGLRVIFQSSEGPGPRYRLTYWPEAKQIVKGQFEVAPPGGAFKSYLSWTSTKVN